MRIVAISPHRDDAAFSLGLSIAYWLSVGHKVQVLNCFTQSAYAPYSDADSLHANDRMSFVSAIRKREDAAWNKLPGSGKLQMTDLDLMDAPLRLALPVEEAMKSEIRAGDRAVARVQGAVAKLAKPGKAGSGDDLAVLLPLAVGGHVDHRVVRQAGLDGLSGSPIPLAFYEDLPYAARPEEAETLAQLVGSTGLALQAAYAERAHRSAELQCMRKQRMAECYDSQIDSEVAEQIANFCVQYAGRERLWANDAWLRSVLAVLPADGACA